MSDPKWKTLFSSKSIEWVTPDSLYNALYAEFEFTLDAAANIDNTKCNMFIDETIDSLTVRWSKWGSRVWLNPPYTRNIGNWIRKAYTESRKGGIIVVCLVFARTDTAWWQDWAMRAHEIRLIRGRVTFTPTLDVEKKYPAPAPSAILVFDGTREAPMYPKVYGVDVPRSDL
jgi:phage N-6-adenine-methyltransferase